VTIYKRGYSTIIFNCCKKCSTEEYISSYRRPEWW